MGQNLKSQVKPVRIYNKQFVLKEKDNHIGMEDNFCSKFVKSINVIFRGENNNPNHDKRNSVITGTNLINGQICKTFDNYFQIRS